MKKFWQTLTGVNIIIAIVAINVAIAFLPSLSIDLTKDKLHSLSAASKKEVKNLKDVVNVKVFVTNDLPAEIAPIAKDLQVILKDFEQINRAKLHVTYYDPSKDGNAAKEATKYGIQTLQFSSVKSDKFEVQNGYFGLVMLYGSKQEVLPVINDVGNLEYFMVSGIKRITSNQLPTVAVAEDPADSTGSSAILYLRKFLARTYNVVEVTLDGESKIPENAQTLLIAGRTKKIDDKGLKKITDWVNNGKGLITFLDRVSVGQNMQAQKNELTGLEKIYTDRGMAIEDKLIVDQNATVANFQTKSGSFLVKYPYWPQVTADKINQNIPALSGINSLNFAWASPIKLSNKSQALASSSTDSQLDDSFIDITPVTKAEIKGDKKSYAIAAINTQGSKLALVGDEDFVKDQFVVNNQQNLVMALNLVDYFSQDSSLLQIRSKILKSSPLKSISDQQKIMVKWLDMAAPILILVAVFGISVGLRKRKINSWYEME